MITIGVPTFNGAWRLRNLLKSIAMRTPEIAAGEARVVVVDDGSPVIEQTRAVIAEMTPLFPPGALAYVEHGTNKGISAGWNTASRHFDCEYVALANDDVIMASGGWLRALTYVLANSPNVGVVGPNWHAFIADDVAKLLESPDSDLQVIPRDPCSKAHTPSRRDLEPCDPGRVMAPGGQLFAFRRADFDAIGGFDENFKSFFEETDFGTAMAAKLKKIGLGLNWPQCWHMWSATFNANPQLNGSGRMAHSREFYRQKWGVPGHIPQGEECGQWTNPKNLGAVPDVEVAFLRGTSGEPWRGRLRQDGAFVDGHRVEVSQ
jgi:GT2 family glycosyltransferase